MKSWFVFGRGISGFVGIPVERSCGRRPFDLAFGALYSEHGERPRCSRVFLAALRQWQSRLATY